jgi:hypothetical protein
VGLFVERIYRVSVEERVNILFNPVMRGGRSIRGRKKLFLSDGKNPQCLFHGFCNICF